MSDLLSQELSTPAKLLLLISLLSKDRFISNNGMCFLKEMILRRDTRLFKILNQFESKQPGDYFLDDVHAIIQDEVKATYDQLFLDTSLEVGKTLSKDERDRKNLNTEKSLIYGEVDFKSFYRVLRKVNPAPGAIFYDLGSGTSKAVFAARLMHDFSRCTGIEILSSLHNQARKIVERYNADFRNLLCSSQNQHASVYMGSFLDFDWTDGDLVFANSTCFDDELMYAMAKQAEGMKPGAIFVTFTKGLNKMDVFELLERKRYRMSWGPATVFIHRRLGHDGNPVGPPLLNTFPSDAVDYDEEEEEKGRVEQRAGAEGLLPSPYTAGELEDDDEDDDEEEDEGDDDDDEEDEGDDDDYDYKEYRDIDGEEEEEEEEENKNDDEVKQKWKDWDSLPPLVKEFILKRHEESKRAGTRDDDDDDEDEVGYEDYGDDDNDKTYNARDRLNVTNSTDGDEEEEMRYWLASRAAARAKSAAASAAATSANEASKAVNRSSSQPTPAAPGSGAITPSSKKSGGNGAYTVSNPDTPTVPARNDYGHGFNLPTFATLSPRVGVSPYIAKSQSTPGCHSPFQPVTSPMGQTARGEQSPAFGFEFESGSESITQGSAAVMSPIDSALLIRKHRRQALVPTSASADATASRSMALSSTVNIIEDEVTRNAVRCGGSSVPPREPDSPFDAALMRRKRDQIAPVMREFNFATQATP